MTKFSRLFLSAVFAVGMSLASFGAVLIPSNYSKGIEIAVSGYAGTETLHDFPVLVKLSGSIVDFDYGDFKLANGGDLRFALEDGTILPSEIDTWDETGTSLVWVKVPALEKDAKIFAYYGNGTPEEVSAADVWNDGYAAVYHLGESALPMKESGARATDFTESEGDGIVFAADGAIGKAVNFAATGTPRGLKALDHDKLDGFAAMTVEIWTYQAAHGTVAIVDKRAGYDNDTAWQMYDGNGPTTFGISSVSAGGKATNVNIINPEVNKWNYQVYTYDSTLSLARTKGYLNGVYVNSDNTQSGAVRASAAPLWLGIFQSNDNRNFPGKVDELRISNVARSADWIKAGYDTVNAEGFLTYSSAKDMDDTAVIFDGVPTVEKSGGAFTMSVRLSEESGTAKLSAVYGSEDPLEKIVQFEASATAGNTYQYSFENLAADASYSFEVWGESAKGSLAKRTGTASFYTGTLSIAKVRDADEKDLSTPGAIAVSRADTNGILNVHYTVGGTAIAGTHYEPLSGLVTIPAGEKSATIDIKPIRAKDKDTTVEITLTDGLYFLDDAAKTASIMIFKLAAPEGWNTWVAGADGKASDAANWSQGVPQAGQKILFDPQFSTASCEWDGGVNGLTDSVVEWKQVEGYTGKVTFDTTYSGAFTALSVSGDVTLGGGTWTHLANTAAEEYRLKVVIGGNVAIAAAAKIDASGKGFASGKARPGSDKGCHASPMGSAGADKLYGDVKKPEALGSGSDKGAGGGAIYIEATGSFANEGQLNVNSFGGAAGSIYVKATSVSGAGTYSARAPESVGNDSYMAGSGGRIAFELTDSATITDDEPSFVNGKCTTGFAFNGRNSAAGGTILVKSTTHENGVLYVDGQSGANYSYVRLQPEFKNMLAIPAGDTWVLDGIVFLNKPISALKVPTGTTLSLPGGLASVKAYGSGGGIGGRGGSNATGNRGLVVDGGALLLPIVEEHLIANNWTLQASQSYSLTGDVRVNAGGRIGVVAGYGTSYSYTNRCDLTVTGDLTIESKGSIDATGAGWKNYKDALPAGWGWSVNVTCGAHGGVSKTHSSAIPYVYDSILNPMLPGEGAQDGDAATAQFGGGCVKLTVSGKLSLAGGVNAKSVYQDGNGGAGGTVNITCATIEGSGGINVTTQSGYLGTQGGGGRVAIRLTGDGADFADYPLSCITVTQNGDQSSGGTIYLQTAAEAENAGTVYIKGDAGNTATALTPFPSLAGGGEKDDFSKAGLQIVNNGKVVVSADVKVREFGMAKTGVLNLNGKTLTTGTATLTKSDDSSLALAKGTYSATQLNELTETSVYTDSATGGSLVVTGAAKRGMVIIYR